MENPADLVAAVRYCIEGATKLAERFPGTETPWEHIPLCPMCRHELNRSDILIPLDEHMEKIHAATAHLISDRMRPVVRAMLGHQECCSMDGKIERRES